MLNMAVRHVIAAGILLASPVNEAQNKSAGEYFARGEAVLAKRLQPANTNVAKNVIIVWADGLDVTLATVSRIFAAELANADASFSLPSDNFPHTALARSYTHDSLIGDSAATASAFMTGYKTHDGGISVFGDTRNCKDLKANGYPPSLAELAARAGKATGVVTTTFLSDASPASNYAHSPTRYWGSTRVMPEEDKAAGCKDIPAQLIGSDIDVAMGSGRLTFMLNTKTDPLEPEYVGYRDDGRDLIDEWQTSRSRARVVMTQKELAAVDATQTDALLGLFGARSMPDSIVRSQDEVFPTLPEMTRKAIEVLAKDQDGFFLFIESEESDDLQHAGYAQMGTRAILELQKVVEVALSMTDLTETLIIFTGDHGHTLTFSGDVPHGTPIFGLVPGETGPHLYDDGMPRTILGYRDGPGGTGLKRTAPSQEDAVKPDYRVQALVPSRGESHGGQDVPVYATGPWAHLVSGVLEQNAMFHIIRHAMGLTPE